MTPKVKWKVSLSNGETFYEDKGNFKIVPGEKSPWQRLLLYIGNNNCSITYLGLYTDNNITWNLPSSGKNPKFSIFSKSLKPIGYKMFRASGCDVSMSEGFNYDDYTVIEAEYENHLMQIWVSENNSDNSWSTLIDKG